MASKRRNRFRKLKTERSICKHPFVIWSARRAGPVAPSGARFPASGATGCRRLCSGGRRDPQSPSRCRLRLGAHRPTIPVALPAKVSVPGMSFDSDRFITEVELRPAIWDSRSEAYSNKQARGKAWEELCEIFVLDYEDMDAAKKNTAAADLQRRWKSFRDSFRRELAKSKKTRAEIGRKEYIYYRQLSFLLPICESRPQEEVQEDQGYEMGEEPQGAPPSPPTHPNKRKWRSRDEDHPAQLPARGRDRRDNHPDDADKYFLLSLLPHLKTLPEDNRLEAQGEFINILEKYKHQDISGALDPSYFVHEEKPRRVSPVPELNFDVPKSCPTVMNRNSDICETEAVGISVASKLRRMDPTQAIFAEICIDRGMGVGKGNVPIPGAYVYSDYEAHTLIAHEISPGGLPTLRINGTVVGSSVVRKYAPTITHILARPPSSSVSQPL
ncbi:hypothetical protein AAG570_011746 [Ranatra chinensis]|uniref:MADF domain-containing protein n=1 Tax=Ranatra chinensis TaxID=642074 RepID=A0ABD0YZ68_9HEMI